MNVRQSRHAPMKGKYASTFLGVHSATANQETSTKKSHVTEVRMAIVTTKQFIESCPER